MPRFRLTQDELEFLRNILVQVSKETEDQHEFSMCYDIVAKLKDDPKEAETTRRKQLWREAIHPDSCFCKEPDVDYSKYPDEEFVKCKKCNKWRNIGPAYAAAL